MFSFHHQCSRSIKSASCLERLSEKQSEAIRSNPKHSNPNSSRAWCPLSWMSQSWYLQHLVPGYRVTSCSSEVFVRETCTVDHQVGAVRLLPPPPQALAQETLSNLSCGITLHHQPLPLLLSPQALAQETISNLEKAIAEAKKQCDEASAGECAAAWDTVEELSAAISHKKASVRPISPEPHTNPT